MSLFLALTIAAALDVTPPSALPPSHTKLVGFMDGAGLLHHCAAPETDATGLRDICLGYLAGSTDQVLAMLETRAGPLLCNTSSLNVEDVRLSVLSYLAANPLATKVAGAHVVLNALATSYPCTGLAKP